MVAARHLQIQLHLPGYSRGKGPPQKFFDKIIGCREQGCEVPETSRLLIGLQVPSYLLSEASGQDQQAACDGC